MPCESGSTTDRLYEIRVELERVTRVACNLTKAFRQVGGPEHYLSAETRRWIKEHDEMDRARIRRESEQAARKAERNKAVSKLTPKERKLLGIE